jgi:hypothetical protein
VQYGLRMEAHKAMIDKSVAITLARAVAEKEGWSFVEPIGATFRRAWSGEGGRWEIHTNAFARGTRARFIIDASDGRIIEKGYIPR